VVDIEELLARAVEEPSPVDPAEVRQRVDRRRRRRRAIGTGTVVLATGLVLIGALSMDSTGRDQLATSAPGAAATVPPIALDEQRATIPDGWVSVSFHALHQPGTVPGPVTVWVWSEPRSEPDPVHLPEPEWRAFYQAVELGSGEQEEQVGPALARSLFTATVPPEAAQSIATADMEWWLAVTPQPDGAPSPCSSGPQDPRCPHHPTFTPPAR
jgi:hypothetical protein